MYSIGETKPYQRSSLLGIVSSYVPYRDVAYSEQTKKPRMIFEENSGLASVVPAGFIRDTVLLSKKRLKKRIAQQQFRAKKKN